MEILVRRGFIWGPSPEIYKGLAGFYDFGPLGKLVKNEVENFLRRKFMDFGFYEVECPTIMPRIVWEASGHLERFVDPMTKCEKCNSIYRADHLIKERKGKEPKSMEEMRKEIKEIKCPKCGSPLKEVIPYNLMIKTTIGLDKEAYLRPETATTTYLLFPRLFQFFRKKLPIKVFQLGKAYRNEISPRQGVIRMREFTQIEAQMFLKKEQEYEFEVPESDLPLMPYKEKKVLNIPLKEALKRGYVKKPAFAWCLYVTNDIVKEMGFREYRFRQHEPEERAHYADDAWDVEVKIGDDWVEVCGVHDRTDYDLSRHSKFSGVRMEVDGEVPQVLEIAFGSERLVYALLVNSVREEKERVVMGLKPQFAPIKVAVFPLVERGKLVEKAKGVLKEIACLHPYYDEKGSIGRRYRRQDEIGTPFCVTIDHQTLEDDTVTVRERDSMKQERVKINELKGYLLQRITFL